MITLPGIGPLIASAMVAAIGNGTAFAEGRDFAAWLACQVPKATSTGDRTILGRISKRGREMFGTFHRKLFRGHDAGRECALQEHHKYPIATA